MGIDPLGVQEERVGVMQGHEGYSLSAIGGLCVLARSKSRQFLRDRERYVLYISQIHDVNVTFYLAGAAYPFGTCILRLEMPFLGLILLLLQRHHSSHHIILNTHLSILGSFHLLP